MLRGAVLLFVAMLLLVFALQANANTLPEAAQQHTGTYTQQGLVELLRKALDNPQSPNLELVSRQRGHLPAEEGYGEQDSVGELFAPQIEELLKGKLLLETVQQQDGCILYVAFDLEALQLIYVGFNPTEEVHTHQLTVEQMRTTSGALNTYVAVPQQADTDVKAPESSAQSTSAASLRDVVGVLAGALPPEGTQPGEADTQEGTEDETGKQDTTDSEQQSSSKAEPTQPGAANEEGANTEAPAVGLAAIESHSLQYNDIQGEVQLTLDANGMGCLVLNTGPLYGGYMGNQPMARRSGITGPGGQQANLESTLTGNVLRIYSANDVLIGTSVQGPANNFATYSGDNHAIYYTVDTNSTVDISRGNGPLFDIELCNSRSVTIAGIDASAIGLPSEDDTEQLTIKGVATANSTTRRLTVDGSASGADPVALLFDKQLHITAANSAVTPEIQIRGNQRSLSSAVVAEADHYLVKTSAFLRIDSGAVVSCTNKATGDFGVHSSGKIQVSNATLNSDGSKFAIQSNGALEITDGAVKGTTNFTQTLPLATGDTKPTAGIFCENLRITGASTLEAKGQVFGLRVVELLEADNAGGTPGALQIYATSTAQVSQLNISGSSWLANLEAAQQYERRYCAILTSDLKSRNADFEAEGISGISVGHNSNYGLSNGTADTGTTDLKDGTMTLTAVRRGLVTTSEVNEVDGTNIQATAHNIAIDFGGTKNATNLRNATVSGSFVRGYTDNTNYSNNQTLYTVGVRFRGTARLTNTNLTGTSLHVGVHAFTSLNALGTSGSIQGTATDTSRTDTHGIMTGAKGSGGTLSASGSNLTVNGTAPYQGITSYNAVVGSGANVRITGQSSGSYSGADAAGRTGAYCAQHLNLSGGAQLTGTGATGVHANYVSMGNEAVLTATGSQYIGLAYETIISNNSSSVLSSIHAVGPAGIAPATTASQPASTRISVTGKSEIIGEAQQTGAIGIETGSFLVGGYSSANNPKIQATGTTGLYVRRNLVAYGGGFGQTANAADLPAAFASENNYTDPTRSVIVAEGTQIGAKIDGYTLPVRNAVLYASGGETGLCAVGGMPSTLAENTDQSGNPLVDSSIINRMGGTVIALADETQSDSIGLRTEANVYLYYQRLIARGSEAGAQQTTTANAYFYADSGADVTVTGRYGLLADAGSMLTRIASTITNTAAADIPLPASLYARGTKTGIQTQRAYVQAQQGSSLFAVGGYTDSGLINSGGYRLPGMNEDRIATIPNGEAQGYGIHANEAAASGNPPTRIYANSGGKLYAFGNEAGIYATGDLQAQGENTQLRSYGRVLGAELTGTASNSAGALLHATGYTSGLKAASFSQTSGAQSYAYLSGDTSGAEVPGTATVNAGMVVAESSLENHTAAMDTASISVGTDGTLHEIYYGPVLDKNNTPLTTISTPPYFDITDEIPAYGTQMGNRMKLEDYAWTVPSASETRPVKNAASGRHYTQYDETHGTGIVTVNTQTPAAPGLEVLASVPDAVLIANAVPSKVGGTNGGNVSGAGTHRVTMNQALHLQQGIPDYGDMLVQIDLKGYWKYHGDAVFTVTLEGTGAGNSGMKYTRIITVEGDGDLATYKNKINSGSIRFRDVVPGPYTVTVTPAMRTESAQTSKTGVNVPDGGTGNCQFEFDCVKWTRQSGGDVNRNEFNIKP